MSLTHRLFADAFRDMQCAMSSFEQPMMSTRFNQDIMRYPSTDMVESAEGYELHCELPGYDKQNIKIEVADNSRSLVLSGSVRQMNHQKSENEASDEEENHKDEAQVAKKKDSQVVKQSRKKPLWWVNERIVGSFSRTFSFPTPIDADKVKAKFENGVLQIIAPKVTRSQPKRILLESKI